MEVMEPVRVERTYVQKIDARPEEVFPLLCPVRETEWVEGWDPGVVYSKTGVAELDCVFVTGEESVWVITERNPETFTLEILKVTPRMTVGKISIALSENEESGTDARVSYLYTALSREGEDFVRGYTESFYHEFMHYWESELNRYLSSRKNAGQGS